MGGVKSLEDRTGPRAAHRSGICTVLLPFPPCSGLTFEVRPVGSPWYYSPIERHQDPNGCLGSAAFWTNPALQQVGKISVMGRGVSARSFHFRSLVPCFELRERLEQELLDVLTRSGCLDVAPAPDRLQPTDDP